MLPRSAFAPRKRNAPRPAEKSALGFLQFVRGRDCLVATAGKCGCLCGGKIEAAHVDYAGDKGMGTKVSDRYVIPLCSVHHRYQHLVGWSPFETECFGAEGEALKWSHSFWRAWPGRIAWEKRNG